MPAPADDTLGGRARAQAAVFATTHWSDILAAADASSPKGPAALEALCQTYWYPLYAHVRRRGQDHHTAEDLTQEFFARLLDKQWLNSVSPHKGRFRTFLLAALDHFLANDWRRGQAIKRGGGREIVSLEEMHSGGERFARALSWEGASERAFDRAWATTVLNHAMTELQQEFSARGKAVHFEDWKVFLSREATAQDCQASAQRLGMSAGAVTVAVHRFRERYGELLRETVAQTVSAAAEVDEELRYLFAQLNQ